jgi:hypothetical protein
LLVSRAKSTEKTGMNRIVLAVLAWCVALVGLGFEAGCSTPSKACTAYATPAAFDPSSPAVSFKNDVVPIFVLSCAFESCHGAGHGDNQGVYLGSKTASALDLPRLYAATVGKASNELPAMSYVTAGDTANSYLLHKIDGDICTLNARCANASCGDTMPQGNDLLPVETRDVVRRWIAQGAKDN